MPHPQPPLTDKELRIVRGMIDEFETRMVSKHLIHGFVADFRVFLAIVGAALLVVLQVVTLVVMLNGGR